MRTRPLDPDELAALEEQRDFLLGSLDDLEREHEAGDVDEHDYTALRDDYTARAARVIRTIEAHAARVPEARPSETPWRRSAVVAGIAAFALLAGVFVAQASGRREAGESITGNIRESAGSSTTGSVREPSGDSADEVRDRLDEAVTLAAAGRYEEAIALQDEVLADEPGNVEALAYKGWFQFLSGDGQGVVTLIDAVELDPEYPDAHAFLAVAFARLGRPETALNELDRLNELDPPPEVAQLVEGLRAELEG